MKPPCTAQQIQGVLYGGALGDAFASAAEVFDTSQQNSAYKPTWTITDDTQLTLSTCKAISSMNKVSAEAIALSFRADYEQGHLTGLGSSTLGALRALSQNAHWALSGIQGERAAGNGAAMRIAPLAFWLDLNDWTDKHTFNDVVRITHKNEEALAGAQALTLGIQYLLEHPTPDSQALYEFVASSLFDSHTRDRLLELAARPITTYPHAVQEIGSSGYAAHSVPVAFVAACSAFEIGLQPVFTQIVACGGDTDTIASMTGQLFGAAKGVDALPVCIEHIVEKPHLDLIFPSFASSTVAAT